MKIKCFSKFNIDTNEIEECLEKPIKYLSISVNFSSIGKSPTHVHAMAFCDKHFKYTITRNEKFIEISEIEYNLYKILK